ncbi:uncharacterized protein PV09_03134 [Verruconis gallopava]|uniref:Uncharacterized protein n=1 Tax=Verruconis gallopava TaxID=253628 RepID=A0A0D2AHB5_9PEZI|nr:uncharacterized protein PV09_03134 [Verruconis gallopava]KIW05945.1 hypothetical protein PV09_03134 [Verruconis gallopava]
MQCAEAQNGALPPKLSRIFVSFVRYESSHSRTGYTTNMALVNFKPNNMELNTLLVGQLVPSFRDEEPASRTSKTVRRVFHFDILPSPNYSRPASAAVALAQTSCH